MHPDVGHDQAHAAAEQPLGRLPRSPRRLRWSSARSRPSPYDAHHDRPPSLVPRTGAPTCPRPSPRSRARASSPRSSTPRPGSRIRPAIAFFGKHLTYRELLQEVERFSAVLAGLGVEPRRPGRADPAELTPVRDRVLRVPAARRDRGGQQPAVHAARAGAPAQDHAPSVMVVLDLLYPALGGRPRRGAGPRGGRHEAERLHAVPAEPARAAQVQEGREARGQAVAAGRRRTRSVRWWKQAMTAGGPAAAGGRGRRRARRGGARLHGRDDRALEGRDALARQPRRRTSGRSRRASRSSSAARTACMCVLPFFHSFGLVAMNLGDRAGGQARAAPAVRHPHGAEGARQGEAVVVPRRAAALHRDERGAGDREVRPEVA